MIQAVTGLENGIYSLTAKMKNSGGQKFCYLSVWGYGGPEKRASLPVSNTWKPILIRGIEITKGRLDVAFCTDAAAGQWSQLDQLKLVKDGIPYTLLIGGDITELPKVEDAGGRFYENGTEKDCLEILKNNGWNIVRIRLYNDPGNPGFSPSKRLPTGYQNPAATLALAKRAKNKGFQIQLSFHYSDYWSNPGTQTKPHEWEGLSFSQLKTALYDFTYSFMLQMAVQGTSPEFVSIGNEIPGGILFPDGSTSNWPQLAQLLNAGYNAVKAASPSSQVILHLDDACNYDKYNYFFGNCGTHGVQYDIIGVSYYPFWTENTIEELKVFLDAVSEKFNKPLMIMETGYNWNPTRSDGRAGQLANNGPMPYPSTPEGQKDFMLELFSAIPAVQNGKCIGDLYWDPVMITASGVGWELGAPNVVDNTTLFDFKGNALPVLGAFKNNGTYLPPAPAAAASMRN
ncbi:MAG: arabinogalactan endo-1,4-beta-galactosidase [Planctomycetaceae bacterium]|nr:arabinogalactan endo-1,4-beta-galactosidase [Planctomycetaceae bacterium]